MLPGRVQVYFSDEDDEQFEDRAEPRSPRRLENRAKSERLKIYSCPSVSVQTTHRSAVLDDQAVRSLSGAVWEPPHPTHRSCTGYLDFWTCVLRATGWIQSIAEIRSCLFAPLRSSGPSSPARAPLPPDRFACPARFARVEFSLSIPSHPIHSLAPFTLPFHHSPSHLARIPYQFFISSRSRHSRPRLRLRLEVELVT